MTIERKLRVVLRIAFVLLIASVFGAISPRGASAQSVRATCVKPVCNQQKRACIQSFRATFKAAKAVCNEDATIRSRRKCKRQERNQLKQSERTCRNAHRACRRCCFGKTNEPIESCSAAVCGDGVAVEGEECDGADAEACPDACGSDCTCPAPPVP